MKLRTDYRYDGIHLLEERSFGSLREQYPRPTIEYVYLHGQPIAALHSKENADGSQSEAEVSYVFAGRLGEPLVEANEQAQVTWWHQLEGFGDGSKVSKIANVASPPACTLKFPGMVNDSTTGLWENWFRYYDPQGGRYLQAEPLYREPMLVRDYAEAGIVLNPYAYAVNNPLRFVDPTGENPFLVFAGAGAGVGTIVMPGPGTAIGASIGLAIGGIVVGSVTIYCLATGCFVDSVGKEKVMPPEPITVEPCERRRLGERNQTAKPDGTKNPHKKMKENPKNPDEVI